MPQKVRVTQSIFAGGRIWNQGLYPTPELTDIDALINEAEYLRVNNIPFNERAVVFVGDTAEVTPQNDEEAILNTNPTNEVEGEETPDETSNEGEDEKLSAEEFESLNANEQKKYLNELLTLNEDEAISDEEIYSLFSDYQSVATAATVKKLIAEELAKYE